MRLRRLEGQLQLQVEPGPIEDAVDEVVGQIEDDESQEQDDHFGQCIR